MKLKHLLFLLLSCVLFTACGGDDNNDPEGPDGGKNSKIVEQGVDANGIKWVFQKNGTLTISGKGAMANYEPVGDYYTITTPWTPYLVNDIRKIVIKDDVTAIGFNAFHGCYALETLEIGNSVTDIKAGAFEYCEKLTSITIPDNVEHIGGFAFHGCRSLTKLKIGKNIKTIRNYTFDGCNSLEKIEIPNTVTEIWNEAFRGCYAVKELTIPSSITEIGDRAFHYCNALTTINCYCPASAYQYTDIFQREEGNATMYVPASKYAEYEALQNPYWTSMNITVSTTPAPAEKN